MADRRLAVYLDGTPVGTLVQTAAGRLGFLFHDDYASPAAIPLSLSMPIGRSSHPPKAVGAYLAGLLPDSEPTLERWGREYGVSPRSPFALLAHVGMDAAGAVQVLPQGTASPDAATGQGDIRWLTDDDAHAVLAGLAEQPADWNPGRHTGRWMRLHQEDLCQALAVHPSRKYQTDGGPGGSKTSPSCSGASQPPIGRPAPAGSSTPSSSTCS